MVITVKVFKVTILAFEDVRQCGMPAGHVVRPEMEATIDTSNRSIEHVDFWCEARA